MINLSDFGFVLFVIVATEIVGLIVNPVMTVPDTVELLLLFLAERHLKIKLFIN